jgi:hypothetical protein
LNRHNVNSCTTITDGLKPQVARFQTVQHFRHAQLAGSNLCGGTVLHKLPTMTAPAQGKIDRFKLKLNSADCGELGGFLLASHVQIVAMYGIVWL